MEYDRLHLPLGWPDRTLPDVDAMTQARLKKYRDDIADVVERLRHVAEGDPPTPASPVVPATPVVPALPLSGWRRAWQVCRRTMKMKLEVELEAAWIKL